MKHYFSTRVKAVLTVSVLLLVVISVLGSLWSNNLGENMVQSMLTPLRTAASRLTDQAQQLYSYMFRYEAIAAENESLKQQLAQIQDDARRADAVSRENERLRALLEWKKSNENYTLVDAYVIGRSSADWKNTITINRGTNSGIEKEMCAITANGELVGLVSEVGSNYAVIKTVLDSSVEISATIASSGDSGIVKGGYTQELINRMQMNYLPTSASIHTLDQVVTTGSTYYPKDLILGYVVEAGYEKTGIAKYAVLEPAVNVGSLEQVFVVSGYNVG